MSHVAWFVCLCVGHTDEHVLCENGWTDRNAVWGTDCCGPARPRNRVLDGVSIPIFAESFCSRKGWQYGDAIFCQIYCTFNTFVVNKRKHNDDDDGDEDDADDDDDDE